MKNCSTCGKAIDNDSRYCPYCGSKQPKANITDLLGKKLLFTPNVIKIGLIFEFIVFVFVFAFIFNQVLGRHSCDYIDYKITKTFTEAIINESKRTAEPLDSFDLNNLSKEYVDVIKSYINKHEGNCELRINRWTCALNGESESPYQFDFMTNIIDNHKFYKISNFDYYNFQWNYAHVKLFLKNKNSNDKREHCIWIRLVYEDGDWKVDEISRHINDESAPNGIYCFNEKSNIESGDDIEEGYWN